MAQSDYLFNTENKEENFNTIISFLKKEGYQWIDKDISFKEVKQTYFKDGRKKILVRAFYNNTNNKKEIQLTYLSQYNKMRNLLNEKKNS